MTTHQDILRGIARGVWADHWATEQEEAGESFSGMDLYDIAPEAPAWACKWATNVGAEIEALNAGQTLSALYALAQSKGFTRNAETFGSYLGMQTVGHGVCWHDDLRGQEKTIKLPRHEFYEV